MKQSLKQSNETVIEVRTQSKKTVIETQSNETIRPQSNETAIETQLNETPIQTVK